MTPSPHSSHHVGVLEGSWVDISGVTSRVTLVLTHIKGLITLLNYP